MNQQEHLDKIVAKCRELLAAAEKRTPGSWERDACSIYSSVQIGDDNMAKDGELPIIESGMGRDADLIGNLNFIASCAGPAEAGWRATIASVEGLQRLARWNFQGWEGDHGIIAEIEAEIDTIIAAWPIELLS